MTESSHRIDGSLSAALSLARDALADEPAGLLTDFDGTLSMIASDPLSATLVEGAAPALSTLAERLAVVALVTGRAPLDARRLAGVPGLLIAGNHGMEWLEPDADEAHAAPGEASFRDHLNEVIAGLPDLPGIVVEHKGVSASVHYRNAPDPDATRAAILDALGDIEHRGLRIGHGRMIVELRPIGLGDKGSAVHVIVERYRLRGVVVMGDDITDLDMFRAVDELRAAGRIRGTIIGVGSADHEAPGEIVAAADAMLVDPVAAARFLVELAGSR